MAFTVRRERLWRGQYPIGAVTTPGVFVVALVYGSDATLKRFYKEGNLIRLQPSNTEMAPIYAPAANVAIQGKVLGLLRKYA